MRPRSYAMIALGCLVAGVLLWKYLPGSEGQKEDAIPVAQNAPSSTLPVIGSANAASDDPDPILSRELETALEIAGRYGARMGEIGIQSVECRGSSCLLALVSRNTTRRASPTLIVPLMEELKKTPPRNPRTGEVLSLDLQNIEMPGDTASVLVEMRFNADKR